MKFYINKFDMLKTKIQPYKNQSQNMEPDAWKIWLYFGPKIGWKIDYPALKVSAYSRAISPCVMGFRSPSTYICLAQ
ncbi:hypothetical protein HALA3H3_360107 [Halomonas sp. A3H3]|nr:hypothetical protein HALA3H3_360107 [Halomonas sp. A3H3]